MNFTQNEKKKIDKSALMEIRKHLRHFHILTAKACSETVMLREFSNKDFHSL